MSNYTITIGTDIIAVVTPTTVKIDACGKFTKERFSELINAIHWECYPCSLSSVHGHWIIHTDAGEFPFNYTFTLERGVHY